MATAAPARGANPFDDSVPLPGATVDPKTVVDYAREHLADFKVPQFITVSAAGLAPAAGVPAQLPFTRSALMRR
jgi:hypothetical protein